MFDERTNLGQQVATDVRQFFKEKVFRTVIPRNVRLGEAPSHGMPVILYDAKSRGAEAYLALAREVLERSAANGRMTTTHQRTKTRRTRRADIFSANSASSGVEGDDYGKTPRARQRSQRAHPRRARTAARRTDRGRYRSPRAERLPAARAPSTMRACAELARVDQGERHHPADRRPQGRRSLSDHRRRAPLARRASSPACCACPVVVRDVAPGQEQSLLEMALIENIQREDLNPIDEALAYRRLADEFQLKQEDIATAVGKDRASVANSHAAAQAARRSPRRSRRRAAVDGPRARAARRSPTKPISAASRATSSRAASRCAKPSRWSRRSSKAARRRREAAPPKPVDVHTRAAEDRLKLLLGTTRPHRPTAARAAASRSISSRKTS